MSQIKNHALCLALFVVVIIAVIAGPMHAKFWPRVEPSYSYTDLGVSELTIPNCSTMKNGESNYSTSISFSVYGVASMVDKIKLLADKYKEEVSNDSISSYPIVPGSATQESANLTINLKQSQKEFLKDLGDLIKSAGGTDSNYNLANNNGQYGYSPYSSCLTSLQNLMADKKVLEVLTTTLKTEHNTQTISLLTQGISTARTTLQNDINTLNELIKTTTNPTVNISISSLPK